MRFIRLLDDLGGEERKDQLRIHEEGLPYWYKYMVRAESIDSVVVRS